MLDKLLKLYQKLQTEKQSLSFTLEHDKIANWYIHIMHGDSQTEIYNCDGELEDIVYEAYLALKEWETENC